MRMLTHTHAHTQSLTHARMLPDLHPLTWQYPPPPSPRLASPPSGGGWRGGRTQHPHPPVYLFLIDTCVAEDELGACKAAIMQVGGWVGGWVHR